MRRISDASTCIIVVAIFCVLGRSDGFSGVSERIFSRRTTSQTPKVQYIPLVPSAARFQSTSTFKGSSGNEEVQQRKGLRNRVNSAWTKIRRPRNYVSKSSRRAMLISAASALTVLVGRPMLALAMGGGMGGLKGPVAPMERYVIHISRIEINSFMRSAVQYSTIMYIADLVVFLQTTASNFLLLVAFFSDCLFLFNFCMQLRLRLPLCTLGKSGSLRKRKKSLARGGPSRS
jgi:hypothetical protein